MYLNNFYTSFFCICFLVYKLINIFKWNTHSKLCIHAVRSVRPEPPLAKVTFAQPDHNLLLALDASVLSEYLLAYGGIDAAWPVAACALSDSGLVNGCICVVWFYTLLVSGGIRAVVNRASFRLKRHLRIYCIDLQVYKALFYGMTNFCFSWQWVSSTLDSSQHTCPILWLVGLRQAPQCMSGLVKWNICLDWKFHDLMESSK